MLRIYGEFEVSGPETGRALRENRLCEQFSVISR